MGTYTNQVMLACEVCGGEYSVPKCYEQRIRTCSPECKRQLPALRTAAKLAAVRAQFGHIPDRTPPSISGTARIRQECSVCGAAYLIYPDGAARYVTCSRACSTVRRKSLGRLGTVERTCETCRATFSIDVCQIKGLRTGQYCSNKCRLAGLNSAPREPAETAQCRTCGNPFKCPRSFKVPDADGKTRGVYCSRACMWTDDDYRKRRAVRHSPSKLELWLFSVLDAEGIAYDSFATVGRYVPDALLPDYKVIIEVDGVIWHRKKVTYDQQRDRDLTAAGYTVMHFTDLEMTSGKAAKRLLGAAVADIRAGRAAYRPPLLWKPGHEPGPSPLAASAAPPTQDM